MGSMWFDSHVHFDRFVAQERLELLLEKAVAAKVNRLLSVGGSPEANELSRQLASAYEGLIFASAGYDRDLADEAYDGSALEMQVADPLVRAVGETGLDYFHQKDNKKAQQALFGLNLELAVRYEKPVIVHSRAAEEDTLAMLADYADQRREYPGVLHCFTLDQACARRLLDLGFMISFSGIVTFANADALREVVAYIPEDRLLVETDSPYLAPIPERGKENEPAFVRYTGAKLAELLDVSVEALAQMSMQNAWDLFGCGKKESAG